MAGHRGDRAGGGRVPAAKKRAGPGGGVRGRLCGGGGEIRWWQPAGAGRLGPLGLGSRWAVLGAAARPAPFPSRHLAVPPRFGLGGSGLGVRGQSQTRQIGRVRLVDDRRGPADRAARAVQPMPCHVGPGGLQSKCVPHTHTDGHRHRKVDTQSRNDLGSCVDLTGQLFVELRNVAELGAYQTNLFAGGEPEVVTEAAVVRHRLDDLSWVDVAAGWLRGADTLLIDLAARLPWTCTRRRMYDRMVDEARLSAGCELGGSGTPPVIDTMAAALDACGCRKLCRGWSGGISVLIDESVTAGGSHDLEVLKISSKASMNWLACRARAPGHRRVGGRNGPAGDGGLADPDAGGVVRDPCEVDGSGGDVDEEQQVEPA